MPRYNMLNLIIDGCCRVSTRPLCNRQIKTGKSACAYLLVSESNKIIFQSSHYLGELTVAQAEYSALLFGLNKAAEFCRDELVVWTDSSLVVGQMSGQYTLRSSGLKYCFDKAKLLERRFNMPVKYFHHSRGSFWARKADQLANRKYSQMQTG